MHVYNAETLRSGLELTHEQVLSGNGRRVTYIALIYYNRTCTDNVKLHSQSIKPDSRSKFTPSLGSKQYIHIPMHYCQFRAQFAVCGFLIGPLRSVKESLDKQVFSHFYTLESKQEIGLKNLRL